MAYKLKVRVVILSIITTFATLYVISGQVANSGGSRSGKGGFSSKLWAKKSPVYLNPSINVTANVNHYQEYDERIMSGNSYIWEDPSKPHDFSVDGVIDEIAERTFVMLKTGAEVMWERLPIHLTTTFKRFPHHQIYCDGAGRIGDETILDCLAMLPTEFKFGGIFTEYDYRQQAIANAFNWHYQDVRVGTKGMGWDMDRFKNVPMLYHAWLNAPKGMDWFVMVDDDTYMLSATLGSLLRNYDPSKPYYFGAPAVAPGYLASVGKYVDRKKAENPSFDEQFCWFAHGGSGIIMSRGVLDGIFSADAPAKNEEIVRHYTEVGTKTSWGDAVLGYLIRDELNVLLNENTRGEFTDPEVYLGKELHDTSVHVSNICQTLGSFHHIDSFQTQKIFEWEGSLVDRKPNSIGGVLFSDYYHDFVLPYIVDVREDWDNLSEEVSFENDQPFGENDPDLIPAESSKTCNHVCDLYVYCLQWKWSSVNGQTKCSFGFNNVVVGKSTSALSGKDSGTFISGWKPERIRKIRSTANCDPLTRDFSSKGYNDDDDTMEGWYLRSLRRELEQKTQADWHYNWTVQHLV